jgi:GntP family gluconate:H+ symporter
VAIELLKADAGKTILYSLIVGVPAAIVAGPLLVGMLERRVPVAASASGPAVVSGSAGASARTSLPGFWLTLATILLPVILMLLASAADMTLPKTSRVRAWFDFLGSPLMAMLLAVLFSLYSFGIARGFNRQQLLKFTDECLGPVATVLLVVGAGGAFNKVLVYSGVTTAIGDSIKGVSLSPLVLGWLVAVFIRVATGSATVAITTASGILAPIAARTPGTNLELLVIAMGAGSIILSHLNDGGFWFVKEYLGLSVSQTLKTWTVVETVISVVALIFVLLLNRIV